MAKQTALQCVDACLACEQLRLQAAATGMLSKCLTALLPPTAPSPTHTGTPDISYPDPHPHPPRSRQQPTRRGHPSSIHPGSGNQVGPYLRGPAPGGETEELQPACDGEPTGLPTQAAGDQQQQHSEPGAQRGSHGNGCIRPDESSAAEDAEGMLNRAQYLPLFCRIACHCMLLAEASGEAAAPGQADPSSEGSIETERRPRGRRRAPEPVKQQNVASMHAANSIGTTYKRNHQSYMSGCGASSLHLQSAQLVLSSCLCHASFS